jgi:hypothetical protein
MEVRHDYEARLPYTRTQFSGTFEVMKFGHPKRLQRLVTTKVTNQFVCEQWLIGRSPLMKKKVSKR